MGQADVRVPNTAIPGALFECSGEPQLGSSGRPGSDLHLSERRLENPDAERFEAGFLGGEPRCQSLNAIRTTRARLELARREHPFFEVARRGEGPGQPLRVHDVQTDAHDHDRYVTPVALRDGVETSPV